jgi:1,4-alpha-glucan branching enzyme
VSDVSDDTLRAIAAYRMGSENEPGAEARDFARAALEARRERDEAREAHRLLAQRVERAERERAEARADHQRVREECFSWINACNEARERIAKLEAHGATLRKALDVAVELFDDGLTNFSAHGFRTDADIRNLFCAARALLEGERDE